MKQRLNYTLYTYDYETGKSEQVTDKNVRECYVDSESNTLYYFECNKGLYKCNLSDGKESLIYKADENMVSATLSYDGKYLYLCNNGSGSITVSDARINVQLVILNTDGSKVNTVDFGEYDVSMLFGDEDYIFAEKWGTIMYMKKSDIVSGNGQWIELQQ